MKKRHQSKPPYVGWLLLDLPDGSQRSVKLPSGANVQVGAREDLKLKHKGLPFTVRLVRVEGGWEVRGEK